MSDWEKIGVCDVDAGLIWIGDPCYLENSNKEAPAPDDDKRWSQWCDLLTKRMGDSGHAQINGNNDDPGLGCVVSSGWGDGTYSVYVQRTFDGRIGAAKIIFDEEEEEEEY
jgi:hypothetical protein